MSRMGDAKYASEMIPRKIKMNPKIEAALPGTLRCIGNLPGERLGCRTSLFALVILWACDSTADGLAGISNFGLFSFQVCEEEHFAYLLFQLNIFWVPQKGVALLHPEPRQ
jgi:hypothetical protein